MKGLRSLDTSITDVTPSYVSVSRDTTPTEAFKPSKFPPKGKTEMTQDERHSAHLRKKRQQKVAKRVEESRMQVMSKWDPKIRAKLEKRKVIDTLSANRNVTIVGAKAGKAGSSVSFDKEKKGKKWKHNLKDTLLNK